MIRAWVDSRPASAFERGRLVAFALLASLAGAASAGGPARYLKADEPAVLVERFAAAHPGLARASNLLDASPTPVPATPASPSLSVAAPPAPESPTPGAVPPSAPVSPIPMLEIGMGDDDERARRPAMLVVAGIEGDDLAGPSIVLRWLERLLETAASDPATSERLRSITIYAIPRLNLDAARGFSEEPRRAFVRDARPADDDHDGLLDEDPPDDLNGDGVVAWMRVEHPEGKFVPHPEDPRVLIEAEPERGERGAWMLLPEGLDDDGDERWNEDDLGGVNLDRNFPYGYDYFANDSGPHPVSEPATRALADFVVARPNIALVFVFGDSDSLVAPPDAEPGSADMAVGAATGARQSGRRPPTGLNELDRPWFEELGEAYRRGFGLEKPGEGASRPGSFVDWMYFHRGRLALAARPWSLSLQKAMDAANARETSSHEKSKEPDAKGESEPGPTPTPAPAEAPEKMAEAAPATQPAAPAEANQPPANPEGNGAAGGAPADKPDEKAKPGAPRKDSRGKEEIELLEWIDANAPDHFLEWKPFEHPDFPDRRVELGGFAPFVKKNPPESLLEPLALKHADFLTTLTARLPRLAFRKAEALDLGDGVFEIEIEVENAGWAPTALAQGDLTGEVLPTRVLVDVPDDAFLGGRRITRLASMDGSGGMERVRVVVFAPDRESVLVRAASSIAGTIETTLPLKSPPPPAPANPATPPAAPAPATTEAPSASAPEKPAMAEKSPEKPASAAPERPAPAPEKPESAPKPESPAPNPPEPAPSEPAPVTPGPSSESPAAPPAAGGS